jgi:hypothetical protein
MPEQIVAASAGFLIAVLWFDLIFDVQVVRHHRSDVLPAPALASVSAYYRRVTTTASPMGRLVGVTMAVLLGALLWQAARGDSPVWVSAVSMPAAALAIGLAVLRVFRRARRLGERADTPAIQTWLARSILRDHLVCLAAMSLLLTVQLAAA